jgi:hypothetical protein
MNGRVGAWKNGKANLRIAHSNKTSKFFNNHRLGYTFYPLDKSLFLIGLSHLSQAHLLDNALYNTLF